MTPNDSSLGVLSYIRKEGGEVGLTWSNYLPSGTGAIPTTYFTVTSRSNLPRTESTRNTQAALGGCLDTLLLVAAALGIVVTIAVPQSSADCADWRCDSSVCPI